MYHNYVGLKFGVKCIVILCLEQTYNSKNALDPKIQPCNTHKIQVRACIMHISSYNSLS